DLQEQEVAEVRELFPSPLEIAHVPAHAGNQPRWIVTGTCSAVPTAEACMSMRSILVAYGTTDGQTAKIAEAIGQTIREIGVRPDVVNLAESRRPSPSDYDAVIIAASVHAGGYQRAVRRWVTRELRALAARPTAFVSVCLGVLQHDAIVDAELERI